MAAEGAAADPKVQRPRSCSLFSRANTTELPSCRLQLPPPPPHLPENLESVYKRFAGDTEFLSKEITTVLTLALDLLREEATVLHLRADCRVVGSVRGQAQDVLQLFRLYGWPDTRRYLFLGDHLYGEGDTAGRYARTLLLLLLFKILYPENVFLLRGPADCEHCCSEYTADFLMRYSTGDQFELLAQVLNFLPLAALVGKSYFFDSINSWAEHSTVAAIEKIARPYRACSFRVGLSKELKQLSKRAEQEFLKKNNLLAIVRSIRLSGGDEGYGVSHLHVNPQNNVVEMPTVTSKEPDEGTRRGALMIVHRNCFCSFHTVFPTHISDQPDARMLIPPVAAAAQKKFE